MCWNIPELWCDSSQTTFGMQPKQVYNRFACCNVCNILTFHRLQTRDQIGWHLTEPLSRQVVFFSATTLFVSNRHHSAVAPFGPRREFRAGGGTWARSVSARTAGSTGSPTRRWRPWQVWRWIGRALCARGPLLTPSLGAPQSPLSRLQSWPAWRDMWHRREHISERLFHVFPARPHIQSSLPLAASLLWRHRPHPKDPVKKTNNSLNINSQTRFQMNCQGCYWINLARSQREMQLDIHV